MVKARIGVYGLGTMGSALALNIAENGFSVAVTNRNTTWIDGFLKEAEGLKGEVTGHMSLEAFVVGIETPRAILFMIPSGAPLDSMIEKITPLLSPGDRIIDGGNSDFHETRRRQAALEAQGFVYIGMGVSGGEEGARFGPSIMVGGEAESFEGIRDIIEAISAKYEGDPCADRLGPDGAGHFVKTVHNGIEYADMQMIAEVWGILRNGKGWSPAEAGGLFTRWNAGALQSYLVEITGKALVAIDPKTGNPMIDMIVDKAGQKGTGRWTVIEALKLGQSASAIEAAVGGRSWSADRELRAAGEAAIEVPDGQGAELSEETLESALLTAKITAYAQGLTLLQAASEEFNWNIDLARVAEVWRAGCIIRSALLDDISSAVRAGLPHGNLILAPAFLQMVKDGLPALRQVVASAALRGLPVPAMSASLAYIETLRRARGTTDLVQAQRDFFGAHGFERRDAEGKDHHGPWAMSAG